MKASFRTAEAEVDQERVSATGTSGRAVVEVAPTLLPRTRGKVVTGLSVVATASIVELPRTTTALATGKTTLRRASETRVGARSL